VDCNLTIIIIITSANEVIKYRRLSGVSNFTYKQRLDLYENFTTYASLDKDVLIRFWELSGSGLSTNPDQIRLGEVHVLRVLLFFQLRVLRKSNSRRSVMIGTKACSWSTRVEFLYYNDEWRFYFNEDVIDINSDKLFTRVHNNISVLLPAV